MDEKRIDEGMTALAGVDPRIAAARATFGDPAPRIRPRGYGTLLRAIVSQQVSTAAASSIWRKLEAAVGDLETPHGVLAADFDILRAAGLSRQKIGYAQSLAAHVAQGSLPVLSLPANDEEAIGLLSSVKGLGRWSAEIYLLFAEGRADVFPAGDLALQVQAGRMFRAGERPGEKQLRELAAGWQPHRSVAALFLWHCYNAPPL